MLGQPELLSSKQPPLLLPFPSHQLLHFSPRLLQYGRQKRYNVTRKQQFHRVANCYHSFPDSTDELQRMGPLLVRSTSFCDSLFVSVSYTECATGSAGLVQQVRLAAVRKADHHIHFLSNVTFATPDTGFPKKKKKIQIILMSRSFCLSLS